MWVLLPHLSAHRNFQEVVYRIELGFGGVQSGFSLVFGYSVYSLFRLVQSLGGRWLWQFFIILGYRILTFLRQFPREECQTSLCGPHIHLILRCLGTRSEATIPFIVSINFYLSLPFDEEHKCPYCPHSVLCRTIYTAWISA